MTRPRIVVTGLGAVSGYGAGTDALWRGLVSGTSAIRQYDRFDSRAFPVRLAAQADDWETEETRALPRSAGMGWVAAREALRQAGLLAENTAAAFCAAVGWQPWDDAELSGQSQGGADPAAGFDLLRRKLGLRGPAFSSVSACAASTQAIGTAIELLRSGVVPCALVGGADTRLHPQGIIFYHRLGALSTAPDTATLRGPFDRDRSGFVIGEGAGFLVLEVFEHARDRGAQVLAELEGWASNADAFRITDPEPQGAMAAACIREAMADAAAAAGSVDAINAHGTATPANDRAELAALRGVFGPHLNETPIVALKGLTGHLSMAAGAVETVATVLMLRHQILPPHPHVLAPDDPADAPILLRSGAMPSAIRRVVKFSAGFGGQNAALIISSGREDG